MATVRQLAPADFGTSRLVMHSACSAIARMIGGAFVAAAGAGYWFVLTSGTPGGGDHALMGVLGAFLAVGAIMLLHVARRVIDRDRRQVEIVWGVIVPFSRKTFPLDTFDHVRLEAIRVRTQNGGSQTQYCVSLTGKDDQRCGISVMQRYQTARERAERIAGFINLPLADHTAGAVSVRQPDALDQPAVERWRSEGGGRWVDPPLRSRIRVSCDADARVVTLPPAGMSGPIPLMAIAMAPGLLVPLFVFQSGIVSIADLRFVAPLFLVPVVGVALVLLWVAAARERVRVNKQGVTITRRFGPLARTLRIPADELEELVERRRPNSPLLGNWSGGITLRSDKRTCMVGVSLSEADRDWLANAIRWALTH